MNIRTLPCLLLAGSFLFSNFNSDAQCSLNCPGTITQVAAPGVCGANVNYAVSGDCGNVTYSKPSGSFFPVGTTIVTATASGQTCSFSVTVTDNQAPVISSMSANPSMLWPPNHKMRDVQVTYTSTDNCAVVGCTLAVSSNEPQNGLGDGDTEHDWEIVSPTMVRLRAERSGLGNGRIYTITATCSDAAGNTSSQSTVVTVPHDMGKGGKKEMSAKAISNGSGHFTIQLEPNGSSNKIAMTVTDAFGRVIESRANVGAVNTLQIGQNYRPGVYNIELVQGTDRVTLRLVK
jgi:hypothetical protein